MQNGYNALTKEQKKSFIQSYLLHISETDEYQVEGLDPKDIKGVDEETVEVKFENKNYISHTSHFKKCL